MTKQIQTEYYRITKKIADKIVNLRRANNLTQEEFAERVNLERRTIARCENGKFRPADKTLIAISISFNIPMSYFYDNSIYEEQSSKTEIVKEIGSKLNVLSKEKLDKINKIIDFI